ncbi:MAG: hypothetical protein EBR82_89075 [Caulobacteraceae bacterium]|nr:hypothetical protein [Caulobacteraceae bacterium]
MTDETTPHDGKAMPPASAGYADVRLVAQAFREVIDTANEASRAHATNYAGLIHALLGKGAITAEELEAGRQKAKPAVDEHFGPTPDERKAKELAELLQRLKGKA